MTQERGRPSQEPQPPKQQAQVSQREQPQRQDLPHQEPQHPAPQPQKPQSQASAPEKPKRQERELWAKRLRHQVGQAIADYGLIEAGDRVMVCVSGGKDSHVLLDLLLQLQQRAPLPFELLAVNLDQKQPGFPTAVLPHYFQERGLNYRIVEEDTYSRVVAKIPAGKTYCSLCSRFRRAILYRVAQEEGITKIALGHHRDDCIETLFLNLFYRGQLKAMPPKLRSDDGHNTVIRPLIYCAEAEIAHYAQLCQFPIIPCDLCGSQGHLQRAQVKAMLQGWEQEHPGRMETIFRSLQNLVPSHLADRRYGSGFEFGDDRAIETPARVENRQENPNNRPPPPS